MPEGISPQEQNFQAPEGGRYVYTEDQLATMPDDMRESLEAAQAAGADVIDGRPIVTPPSTEQVSREPTTAVEQTYHGGYAGTRLSQMPGAVNGPIRIDTVNQKQ